MGKSVQTYVDTRRELTLDPITRRQGEVINAARMPLIPEKSSDRAPLSSSLSLSDISVPRLPHASAKGASGPRLAPAMSDARAVMTIPGERR